MAEYRVGDEVGEKQDESRFREFRGLQRHGAEVEPAMAARIRKPDDEQQGKDDAERRKGPERAAELPVVHALELHQDHEGGYGERTLLG
jgi:hypothetical protein